MSTQQYQLSSLYLRHSVPPEQHPLKWWTGFQTYVQWKYFQISYWIYHTECKTKLLLLDIVSQLFKNFSKLQHVFRNGVEIFHRACYIGFAPFDVQCIIQYYFIAIRNIFMVEIDAFQQENLCLLIKYDTLHYDNYLSL